MSIKSKKQWVLGSGLVLLGIGTFFLIAGIAFSNVLCFGGYGCTGTPGLIGMLSNLWYSIGFRPTEFGLLLATIGLSVTIIGMKRGTRSSYLQGVGVLTFVASMLTILLAAGGVFYVFGAFAGGPPCSFGSTPCSLPSVFTIAVLSTAAFVTGAAASVFSLMGRYHPVVPLGISLLMLSGVIALTISLPTFTSFIAPVVSMCLVSFNLMIIGRRGVFQPVNPRPHPENRTEPSAHDVT